MGRIVGFGKLQNSSNTAPQICHWKDARERSVSKAFRQAVLMGTTGTISLVFLLSPMLCPTVTHLFREFPVWLFLRATARHGSNNATPTMLLNMTFNNINKKAHTLFSFMHKNTNPLGSRSLASPATQRSLKLGLWTEIPPFVKAAVDGLPSKLYL